MMKLQQKEEFRLLQVFLANSMDCAYFAETLPDFDYLRGNGLVSNGTHSAYGYITLTEKGCSHIQKMAERIRMKVS